LLQQSQLVRFPFIPLKNLKLKIKNY